MCDHRALCAVHRAFPPLHLSTTAVTVSQQTERTERNQAGSCADAGRHGNGVSHSHALDQRSGFTGGARRGLNGALCVTAGTSSNPRLPRVTPEKKEENQGAELRLEQTPASPPSLISAFSWLFSFLTLFSTTDHDWRHTLSRFSSRFVASSLPVKPEGNSTKDSGLTCYCKTLDAH